MLTNCYLCCTITSGSLTFICRIIWIFSSIPPNSLRYHYWNSVEL